jgi:hypothetical protein
MRDHEREFLKPPAHDLPAPPAREVAPPVSARPATAQRLAALDTASVLRLQRMAGNQGVVQMLASDEDRSPVHDVVGSGGGQPLDEGTRGTMEAAFGQSFEGVRVHTDAQASKSAESVGANAYTVGSDVVFKGGTYDPGSTAGQRTIAHELSHVVQQSQGPVDGTEAPGGIKVSSPSDRFEQAADHRADQVMASVGSTAATASTSTPAAASAGGVQREEDAGLSMPALQREDVPEEEEKPVGG